MFGLGGSVVGLGLVVSSSAGQSAFLSGRGWALAGMSSSRGARGFVWRAVAGVEPFFVIWGWFGALRRGALGRGALR